MEELISVIVPIFNTDLSTLRICLSCLKKQSYSNLEVLCVDGGSSQTVVDVINDFLSDPRFKLLNTLPGVSHQRNVGIENSRGKFLLFIDSDDFFDEKFIFNLYSALEKNCADIAIPHIHRCDFLEGKQITDIPYKVVQIEETVTEQNYFKYGRSGELVNPIKLYRRNLIGDERFNVDCSYGEDMLFNFELSKKTFITTFVPDAVYYYRVIKGSNSTERRLDKKGLFIVGALASLIKSKRIKNKDAVIGLTNEFDFVFREFYYSLARQKKVKMLFWMIKYKYLYFKRHHGIHDVLFLLFPIMIVSRRNRRAKRMLKKGENV